jgi:acetyl esterase/lipase
MSRPGFQSNQDPRNSTIPRLLAEGFVVIAVDYRLGRPGSPSWPEALDDLREAVRWTRRHANQFGIDPDRIAALGQSSGAHLAALLGTLPDVTSPGEVSSRLQAVVSFYGAFDLADLIKSRKLVHEPALYLLGASTGKSQALEEEASPIRHVTHDDAPMLLLHGSEDRWIPPAQSVRMAEALERANVKHELIVVRGARHGFEALVQRGGEVGEEIDLLAEILAFLQSVWNVPKG